MSLRDSLMTYGFQTLPPEVSWKMPLWPQDFTSTTEGDPIKKLQVFLKAFLMGPLWFLPVDRGYPEELPGGLEELYDTKAREAFLAASEFFQWDNSNLQGFPDNFITLMNVSDIGRLFYERIPSLESFQKVPHSLMTIAAWLYMLSKMPHWAIYIGPKDQYHDDVFIEKVASLTGLQGPIERHSTWADALEQHLHIARSLEASNRLDDDFCTALPDKSVPYKIFVKQYVTSEAVIEDLEAQKQTFIEKLRGLGGSSIEPFLYVDPNVMDVNGLLTYKVLLYRG